MHCAHISNGLRLTFKVKQKKNYNCLHTRTLWMSWNEIWLLCWSNHPFYLHDKLTRNGWSLDFEFESIDRTDISLGASSPAKIPLQLIAIDIQNTLNRICIFCVCLLNVFFYFYLQNYGKVNGSIVGFSEIMSFVLQMILTFSSIWLESLDFMLRFIVEKYQLYPLGTIVTMIKIDKWAATNNVMRSLQLLH